MDLESANSLMRMFARLAQPSEREHAVAELSKKLGIETLLFFTRDPELHCLLVAPGFPQTLPDGTAWNSFAEACIERRLHRSVLPFPILGKMKPVTGLSADSLAVLVLVGPLPTNTDFAVIEAALPLLGAALASEQIARLRSAELDLARQWAREATALAAGLDNARRAAQHEIIARKKAEETLRVTRDELAGANARLEARVQERTQRLSETIAELEAFSYSVSHDMRAPLRSMQAYASVLIEDLGPRLEATERDHLDRISRSAQKLDRLIRDVLTYSRLAGAEIKMEAVALESIVLDALENYAELREPKAEVRVELPLAIVQGHEVLMGQCVSNLLINATKYVAPGVKPKIRVWCEQGKLAVKLWISDNGIGIAPHNHSRIFRMFQRINPEGTYEGTGIGLTVTKKAIERMGGEIGLISEEGQGSQFWLKFSKAPATTTV